MDEFHPVRGQPVTPVKLQRSRELRRAMTEAEKALWDRVRGGQVLGPRFRRQQVLDGFIADFYCHAARLVIEIDGATHTESAEYDAERDTVLAARDLHAVRFTNDDVLKRLPDTLATIRALCATRATSTDQQVARHRDAAPLLPMGEGAGE